MAPSLYIEEPKDSKSAAKNEGGRPAERIDIASRQYAQRTILLNAFRGFGLGIFLMCAAGIGVYMWQHYVLLKKDQIHEARLVENDIEFETAFSKAAAYYDERIRRLQKRNDDLGNQNVVLRKQRDQGRKDLALIIEKKNWIIQQLREITDRMHVSEYERAQTVSMLGALEKRYSTDEEDYKENLEAMYRIEFLRETFPDFDRIRD